MNARGGDNDAVWCLSLVFQRLSVQGTLLLHCCCPSCTQIKEYCSCLVFLQLPQVFLASMLSAEHGEMKRLGRIVIYGDLYGVHVEQQEALGLIRLH